MNDYTTKTASLLASKIKGTKADVRKIDAHEIKVWSGNTSDKNERVNILDLIKSGDVIYDDRGGNITENDIWPNPITLENTFITTDTKGNISINHSTDTYNTFDYSEMTDAQKAITKTAAKVIDNKVLDADGQLLMNWETAAFTNSKVSDSMMRDIFYGSDTLTEWDSDLSSLNNGWFMFWSSDIQTFNGDLSSLTYGTDMFVFCRKLTSFSGDLSSLTQGTRMFNECSSLKSFNSDLPSLRIGHEMFYNAPLESFSGDLSSLENGDTMFSGCKLNAESVHNILHAINIGGPWAFINIGTNIINDSTTLEAQKLEFAKTCLCDSWEELNDDFKTLKQWRVFWQFNGTATSTASTLELTDSNISTALWAKLEEVTEDNEHYRYVSEEDGKHYNIHWFHETNGSTEGYEYFGSLLEACGAFGVIPKEYAESNN